MVSTCMQGLLQSGARDDHQRDTRTAAEDAHQDESFEVPHVAAAAVARDAPAEDLWEMWERKQA